MSPSGMARPGSPWTEYPRRWPWSMRKSTRCSEPSPPRDCCCCWRGGSSPGCCPARWPVPCSGSPMPRGTSRPAVRSSFRTCTSPSSRTMSTHCVRCITSSNAGSKTCGVSAKSRARSSKRCPTASSPPTSAAGASDSQAVGFAQTFVEIARRMQRLVDDLLDLSRIESGGWQPEPRMVGVDAAAREAWRPFAERASSRKVELETATDSAAVNTDPEALRQIFTNLFDNALRHTPAGGRIRVTAERAGGETIVGVSDTGTGIPAEHLPRIFERFYRVDPGRSRQEGGTGLGLSIVKHLVEAHGGRVEAESELGRGTTIVLYFPSVTQS